MVNKGNIYINCSLYDIVNQTLHSQVQLYRFIAGN